MRIVAIAFLLIALAVALVGINPSTAAAQSTTDYDDDEDGLIDVTTLAQLNAMRWDLDGNGDVASTNAANYLLAFPNRDTSTSTRMGCPSGACTGYELRADLDFDTDDDDDVDSSDTYPSWTPIGTSAAPYASEFKGNNYTISNLTINSSSLERIGLFGELSSAGSINSVGLVDVNISLTSFPIGSLNDVGALAGRNQGTVRSVFATGSVTVNTTEFNSIEVGGLVGRSEPGTIAASWANVDVSASGTLTVIAGGLVGIVNGTSIIASYATGSASATGMFASLTYAGGLVGYASGTSSNQTNLTASYATGAASAPSGASFGGFAGFVGSVHTTVTDVYWDTTTTSIADDADTTAPEGKTTSELQSVTSYTGIYANWNVNVDGTTGNDDPWDFGTNSQYPILKFGGISLTAQGRSTTDYDDDDDGLIDVTTLAQLNAMRWDPDGDGDPTATNAASYLTAFPNRESGAADRMGCPSRSCGGYELLANLDFDTDNSGVVDSSDTYPNWTPIGPSNATPYTAEFKGNDHTISNLTISGTTTLQRTGLFGQLSSTGSISGVELTDVNISLTSVAFNFYGGALVGYVVGGTVSSVSATGSVSATPTGTSQIFVGGLVGATAGGTIEGSWASVDVTATGLDNVYGGGLAGQVESSTAVGDASLITSYATGSVSTTGSGSLGRTGGLVGFMVGNGSGDVNITASYATGPASSTSTGTGSNFYANGLVGFAAAIGTGNATITASYATGPVSGSGTTGGLAATGTGATVSNSYWDTGTTGIADDADATAPEGKTTSALQSVTSYTGIYANWNVDVDGTTGNDDPWEFGTGMQYPRLKFDGMKQVPQGSLAMGTPGTNGDNPVVGQLAQVCLVAGPTQRKQGSGSDPEPWIWSKSTDGVSWTNISSADVGSVTYEYTPVSGDVGSYLRACVALNTTLSSVEGAEEACVHPFAKVKNN